MNGYTITNIDPDTKAVYASYVYNLHELNDTVFVDDPTNVTQIQDAIKTAYLLFQSQMDAVDTKPVISPDVQALIGVNQNI